MANPTRKKGRKGDRKFGRNAAKCEIYKKYRYFANKLRKLKAHIAGHPNDANAAEAKVRLYASLTKE